MSMLGSAADLVPAWKPEAVVLDGHYLLYRAYFALPRSIQDAAGREVNGVYGFVSSLLRIVRIVRPAGLVVAFDSPWPTLRHSLYPDYKANRKPLPAGLLAQVPILKDALAAMKVAYTALSGYEADDIIASFVTYCAAARTNVLTVSGDRDLLQVVKDPFSRLSLVGRGVNIDQMLDEAAASELFGVEPSRYRELAALRGDSADNIPAVRGVSKRRALRIVRETRSTEAIRHELEKSSQADAAASDSGPQVFARNLELITLKRAPIDWESLSTKLHALPSGPLARTFEALGLGRLVAQVSSSWPQGLNTTADLDRIVPTVPSRRRICLVSCSASKLTTAATAADLYTSPLFKKSRAWAEAAGGEWYIVSALHGLVKPEQRLEPYDTTLKHASESTRLAWAKLVSEQIKGVARPNDVFFLLAGRTYSAELLPLLRDAGISVAQPLDGMSIGRRLSWLNAAEAEGRGSADLEDFYQILQRLATWSGGPHRLSTVQSSSIPQKGVYFFFEAGETRRQSRLKRVVRVGTHGVSANSRSSLWTRLRTHRGVGHGGGSHRASIFRSHVGASLLARDGRSGDFPQWGVQSNGTEDVRSHEGSLEQLVSDVIGRMEVLFVAIPDAPGPASDRAYIERNSIALLSSVGARMDPSSRLWLGRSSPHPAIRRSGLWNVNFVDQESWDYRFLDVLDYYANATAGGVPMPEGSIAPPQWWSRNVSFAQLQLDWRDDA